MPLIALTGGIASGKSTIGARLAHNGAVVVDADAIVRDLQAPGSSTLAEIAEAFGKDVVGADGALDRAALGRRVFGDTAALARLNSIMHPAVRAESARRFGAAFAENPDAVVVYDVPLLAEARASDPWDFVIVAEAPEDVRLGRLVDLRGMSPNDAAARISSQASDAERRALADIVIDTGGTENDTLRQVDALWGDLGRLIEESGRG